MNSLDIILVIGLAGSIVYSLIRGLVKEIFSLLSVIIGLLVAIRYYPVIAKFLAVLINNQNWSDILSFLILLIAVSLVISLVGKGFRALIKVSNLGLMDRLGGAVFGFVKGLFVAFFMIMLLVAFFPPQTPFIKTSRLLPHVIKMSAVIMHLIPPEIKEKFQEKRIMLTELWEKKYLEELNSRPRPSRHDKEKMPAPADQAGEKPIPPVTEKNSDQPVESHDSLNQI